MHLEPRLDDIERAHERRRHHTCAQATNHIKCPEPPTRNEEESQRQGYQRRRRRRRDTGARGRMWGRDGGGAASARTRTLTKAAAPVRSQRRPASRFAHLNLPYPSTPFPDPRLGRTARASGSPPFPLLPDGASALLPRRSAVGARSRRPPATGFRRLRAPGRPPRVRVWDLRRAGRALWVGGGAVFVSSLASLLRRRFSFPTSRHPRFCFPSSSGPWVGPWRDVTLHRHAGALFQRGPTVIWPDPV